MCVYICNQQSPRPIVASQMLNSLSLSQDMQEQDNFSEIYYIRCIVNRLLLTLCHSPGLLLGAICQLQIQSLINMQYCF